MTNCRYYEWLKKGTQRIPHFMRHKDRRLMLFAGLYDSATLEGEHGTAPPREVSHGNI